MASSTILEEFSDGYSAICFIEINGVNLADLSDIDSELSKTFGSEVSGQAITRQEINNFIEKLIFAEGTASEWNPSLEILRELSEKYLSWKQDRGVQVYDHWSCEACCWEYNDKVSSVLWYSDQ